MLDNQFIDIVDFKNNVRNLIILALARHCVRCANDRI